MFYEWDPAKAATNRRKHGIDFADAVGVFADEYALRREDPDAVDEQRFVALGWDTLGRPVVVVYTYRGEDIRLISARKATKKEREYYARERR
ncbi:MAG: BrnT family toxin [Deltaproteobacteria bacterium]|nr:BrnT family toxin [Deltaproteobacteria bacterium]